jgi:membrane-associated PAP2 superfamily phosphatase
MFEPSTFLSEAKSPPFWRIHAVISVLLMLLLLGWDFSGWDMAMAEWWGDPSGFPLREHWWLVKVMHEGTRSLGWLLLLGLLFSVWRPWGALRNLSTAERAGVFFCVLSALLSVVLTKGFSQTSCPWDLQVFGSTLPYVSHWDFWRRDGGVGHCFPAGHASTAFAFMAVYFGLKQSNAPSAYRWLAMATVFGFVLGISQQIRGAHFMSHTLWTAWLCWTVGWLSHLVFGKLRLKA